MGTDSRTPVWEAIARLETEGLLEMAANRYTRVASLSAAHHDAADLLAALHAWALTHADAVDTDTRRSAADAARALTDGLQAQDLATYRALLQALSVHVAGLGNALYTATESAIRGRVIFNAGAPDAYIDWVAARDAAGALAQL